MDFRDRIAVWEQTQSLAWSFAAPPAFKLRHAPDLVLRTDRHPTTLVEVVDEDAIAAGKRLIDTGYRPLVQILADHRFAGGDVGRGSGAQEESLFRRSNLCVTMAQDRFYPLQPDEIIVTPGVTVFRDTEARRCRFLDATFVMDFVACPGLHNPELVAGLDGTLELTPVDRETLRAKVETMFQAAQVNGNDALVLGAMGCGAWRNPPASVAKVMRDVVDSARGSVAHVAVACLEVDPRDYIVRRRDRPESNYAFFSREFATRP